MPQRPLARDQSPRHRGRPSIAPPGVKTSPVSTRLPDTYHDKLIAHAQRAGVSVSAAARTILILRLTT